MRRRVSRKTPVNPTSPDHDHYDLSGLVPGFDPSDQPPALVDSSDSEPELDHIAPMDPTAQMDLDDQFWDARSDATMDAEEAQDRMTVCQTCVCDDFHFNECNQACI